jgi:hypothetical protein
MSLAFKKYKAGVFLKVLKRTAKLFILGILTQGSDFPALGNLGIDLKRVRIPGILQRIAWAYFVTALIALYVPQVVSTAPVSCALALSASLSISFRSSLSRGRYYTPMCMSTIILRLCCSAVKRSQLSDLIDILLLVHSSCPVLLPMFWCFYNSLRHSVFTANNSDNCQQDPRGTFGHFECTLGNGR